MRTGPTVAIAHAYGNSRRSLRRALEASIDIIEVDVWLRGDKIYIRHDRRLDPLPLLFDRRMRGHALAPFSLPLCRGYYIRPDILPLLAEELLDTVRGRKQVLLDVKGEYPGPAAHIFAHAIVRKITERGAQGWASVCGQFWPVLDRLREIGPEIEVRYSIEHGYQWEKFLHLLDREDLIPRVCIEHRFLDETRTRVMQERGISVYAWTVDDPNEARRLVCAGVDGIISNDLSLLASLRQDASFRQAPEPGNPQR